jgi:hypothetical protein
MEGMRKFELLLLKSEPEGNELRDIPRLIVSSHLQPQRWAPISIYQNPHCRLEAIDEARLEAKVFTEYCDSVPVRTGHVWLPIKEIYPLFIRDCPPEGIVELAVLSLKGVVLDKVRYDFKMRDKWDIVCKGMQFILSRSSERPRRPID